MKDEFTNRIGMVDTSLLNLNKPANKTVWFGNQLLVFTAKVADAAQAVVDLRAFCLRQGTERILGARRSITTRSNGVQGFLVSNPRRTAKANSGVSLAQRCRHPQQRSSVLPLTDDEH